MKKIGMIGRVVISESSDIPENKIYMISHIRPNMRKDGKLPFVKFASNPYATNMFYQKPKWWQFRRKRYYKNLLTTNSEQ